MSDDPLERPGGRTVGFADFGRAGDTPVLWCHGGPGCRLEPEALAPAATRAGLRIIGIDRPGYGRSTPQPGRTIGGWIGDGLAVADWLGIDRFVSVGVSTGGAYALALAAGAPDRVLGTLACCALTDMRWAEGRAMMTASSLDVWAAPDRDAALAIATELFGEDGAKMTRAVGEIGLSASDMALFEDPQWLPGWLAMLPELFAHGVAGYTDDRLADGPGWATFDVSAIRCPVLVLHGASDTIVPVAHARHTAEIVPGARLRVVDGLGHFSILAEVLPALRELLRG